MFDFMSSAFFLDMREREGEERGRGREEEEEGEGEGRGKWEGASSSHGIYRYTVQFFYPFDLFQLLLLLTLPT